MDILLISSPVAPLGDGRTGGVTLCLENMVKALVERGHQIDVMAPDGSRFPKGVRQPISAKGTLQPSLAGDDTQALYPIPENGVLGEMWSTANEIKKNYDAIINLAHDWLPYYLTPFLEVPVWHLVNLGDVNAVTTDIISRVCGKYPAHVAFLSHSHAQTFTKNKTPTLLPLALDLEAYILNEAPNGGLIWAGRISPEKGLIDSLNVAKHLDERLSIAGPIGDEAYWEGLLQDYGSHIDYQGNLERNELQLFLGKGDVLLQTQKWNEAFGLVTIEAMACGTPVIAYDRGANTELIKNGETGYLTTPDSIEELIQARKNIEKIDRAQCRKHIEDSYDLRGFGVRIENWLKAST